MTAQVIPCRTDAPRYSIRVELDAVRFELHFEWNDRAAAWFLDIYDADAVRLVSSIRIVVAYPLLERFSDARLPAGILMAADTTKADLDPLREDLGDRVQLIYTPLADIPADIQALRRVPRE